VFEYLVVSCKHIASGIAPTCQTAGDVAIVNAESCASTWSDASPEQLLGEIFGSLVRILINNGLDPEDMSRAFDQSLELHGTPHEAQKRLQLGAMQRDCMEVMCRWRRDSRFLDSQGLPGSLSVEGDEVSFLTLCEAVSARSGHQDVLATLLELGAVDATADGRVRPLTPTFLLGGGSTSIAIDGVLKQIVAFLRVIDHNTRRDSAASLRPRFERMCTVPVASELLPVFERTVRERGQEFIDGLDEWLERHRQSASVSGSYSEVGVGAYFVDLGSIRPRS
jgi:hypothetical protein